VCVLCAFAAFDCKINYTNIGLLYY